MKWTRIINKKEYWYKGIKQTNESFYNKYIYIYMYYYIKQSPICIVAL